MRYGRGCDWPRLVRPDEPRSRALRWLRAGALAWIVLWTGCNQIAGIYEGEPRECTTVQDCDLGASECRTAECKDGECVYIDVPDGMRVANQVPGDCQEVQCDGQGHTRVVAVTNDSDDGNPSTFAKWVGPSPSHRARPWIECYTGDPLTAGQGICKAGKQVCNAQGEPEGACVGEVLPRDESCFNVFDDDCDGQINEAGADCICAMGAVQPCYASTEGSLGVGECKSGFQECINGLTWGECKSQVLPQPESCATPEDDDCDGEINESGTDCVCGDGILSNFEQGEGGNTREGDGGSARCLVSQCGNGMNDAGEECDDGNDDDTDACTRSCRLAKCGDGIVHAGMEICDDGNSIGGDGCQEDCTPTPMAIGLAYAHSCVVFSNGELKCWGQNWSGELGQEDVVHRGGMPGTMGANLHAVNLGTNRKAKAVTGGEGHTCAILDDDSVKCWGRNDFGQLGLDDTNFRGGLPGTMGDALPAVELGEKARAISAGHYHTCAILESGNVKCWGDGTSGKLGLGSSDNWGDKMGDMAKLPYVYLSPGHKAISVMANVEHTCVVQDDFVIRCWGAGANGRLGQGNVMDYGGKAGEEGGVIVDVGMDKAPVALSVGRGYNACVRLRDGRLTCWGEDQYCQLGYGIANDIGDEPGEMGNALPTVNLGAGRMVLESALGLRQQCDLLSGGIVRCWGDNTDGQLGSEMLIPCTSVGDARTAVDLGSGVEAKHLSIGASHACVILTNGRVKCWGWNEIGQLGLGDTDTRGDAPGEMGDNLPAVSLW